MLDPTFHQASMEGFAVDPLVLTINLGGKTSPAREAYIQAKMETRYGVACEVQYMPSEDDSFRATEAWNDEALPVIATLIEKRMRK